jgi:RNA polymerase sigma-70 factor (ECF subfamily)
VTVEEEAALVARIVSGDGRAFEELVDQHGALLWRLAQSIVKNAAVADEVLQDGWSSILEGLPRFEGRSSLRTWMCRVLINAATRRATREARSVPMSALGDEDETAPVVDPDRFSGHGMWSTWPSPTMAAATPESLALGKELHGFLASEIDKLPEAQRMVLTLRDVEGWDAAEVCNVLEISESNQRVLLHRARSRLRAALERHLEES